MGESLKKLEHYYWMLNNLKLNDHHRWWVKCQIIDLESEIASVK